METEMMLIETTISDKAVRMRFADAVGEEWMEFSFPLAVMRQAQTLRDPPTQVLAEVQRVALRHARDAIGHEMKRLAAIAGDP